MIKNYWNTAMDYLKENVPNIFIRLGLFSAAICALIIFFVVPSFWDSNEKVAFSALNIFWLFAALTFILLIIGIIQTETRTKKV